MIKDIEEILLTFDFGVCDYSTVKSRAEQNIAAQKIAENK